MAGRFLEPTSCLSIIGSQQAFSTTESYRIKISTPSQVNGLAHLPGCVATLDLRQSFSIPYYLYLGYPANLHVRFDLLWKIW